MNIKCVHMGISCTPMGLTENVFALISGKTIGFLWIFKYPIPNLPVPGEGLSLSGSSPTRKVSNNKVIK